ncbi:MAG: hypothetical protein KGS47_02380, partial [Chloroflexi bacterium]|nr:hypothetical protein [Chloroflexota bacterium]
RRSWRYIDSRRVLGRPGTRGAAHCCRLPVHVAGWRVTMVARIMRCALIGLEGVLVAVGAD